MAQRGNRIELLIDFGVAALLAVAAGFAAFVMLPLTGQVAVAAAGATALIAFAIARRVLTSLARRPVRQIEFDLMPLPEFAAVEPLELGNSDEVVVQHPLEPQPGAEQIPKRSSLTINCRRWGRVHAWSSCSDRRPRRPPENLPSASNGIWHFAIPRPIRRPMRRANCSTRSTSCVEACADHSRIVSASISITTDPSLSVTATD